MLLIFGQFALADVGQTVVLVVLGEVKTHLFTIGRHTHRDEHVDEFIASPATAINVIAVIRIIRRLFTFIMYLLL